MCVCPPQGSLSVSQLQQVEALVSAIVSANQIVHTQELPLQRARSISGLRTVDEVMSHSGFTSHRLLSPALTCSHTLSAGVS